MLTTVPLARLGMLTHIRDGCSCQVVLKDASPTLRKLVPSCGLTGSLLKSLALRIEDPCIQLAGLQMFSTLIMLPCISDVKEQKQVIGAALEAVRTHPQHVQVGLQGCRILEILADEKSEVVDELWRQGAMKVMLALLNACLIAEKSTLEYAVSVNNGPTGTNTIRVISQASPDDEANCVKASLYAIWMMYSQASNPCAEADLSDVGRAMSKHMQNARVQEIGILAAGNAMEKFESNIESVGQHGMRAILAAVATHPKDMNVQMSGLRAVGRMVLLCPSFRKTMIEDNGLAVLMRSMEMYQRSEDVQKTAIQALISLAHGDDHSIQELMIKAGCVGAVAKAYMSARQGPGKEKSSEFVSVVCFTLRCMVHPDLPAEVKALALEQNPIEAILHAMSAWPNLNDIQSNGADAICRMLLTHDPGIKTHGHKVVPMVVREMLTNKDWETQVTLCQLLARIFEVLCANETGRKLQDEFAACGGIDAVVNCAKMYRIFKSQEMPSVVGDCCTVLQHAVRDHSHNKRLCASKKTAALLTEIAQFWKEESWVEQTVAATLPALAHTDTDGDEPTSSEDHNRSSSVVKKQDQTNADRSVDACEACGKTTADIGMKVLLKCSACTISPR
jgi:hypothetical protein